MRRPQAEPPSSPPTADLEQRLAALHASYIEHLPARMADIDAAAEIIDHGPDAAEARPGWEALRFHAHKLAGSSATFGLKTLSGLAREIEAACDPVADGATEASAALWGQVAPMIERLRQSAEESVRAGGNGSGMAVPSFGAAATDEDERHVILVDGGGMASETHITDLATFGYRIEVLNSLAEVEAAVRDHPPTALIVDQAAAAPFWEEGQEPPVLRPGGVPSFPIIVVSADGGLRARLSGVRHGCDAFLVKPVDSNVIVDVIERLSSAEKDDPVRVLVVDDDTSMAHHTELLLEGAGMIAEAVTNLSGILEALESFAPELILMDLYMPGANGIEVAEVIRQQEAYAAVPIVFLSGEKDPDTQLGAMSRGGDDFLTKPIQAERLIARVRVRAQRFRRLRELMIHDGLTGLLNHSATLQFLDNEIDRARRTEAPLSFAMIDLDHFKSVNDTHGHAVGDQVIKGLATLLKRRLRSVDVIGRMGGEEFGVVLSGANKNQAFDVMEEIRSAFAAIRYRTIEGDVSVTLSCGIAEYPTHDSSAKLVDAADRALYAAKRAGRDRVALAAAGA